MKGDHYARNELIMVMTAVRQAGIIDATLEDVLNRMRAAFQDRTIDAIDARTWAEGLCLEAPHFFGQTAPAPTAAPASTASSRRPQYRTLTPAELQTLEGLSWSERMTKGRELQQRLAGTTS